MSERALSGPVHARFWREWADQRVSRSEGPCASHSRLDAASAFSQLRPRRLPPRTFIRPQCPDQPLNFRIKLHRIRAAFGEICRQSPSNLCLIPAFPLVAQETGDDIYHEVDRGIRLWDKMLLCCSEHSITSWWVDNEIGTAFEKEQPIMKDRGASA